MPGTVNVGCDNLRVSQRRTVCVWTGRYLPLESGPAASPSVRLTLTTNPTKSFIIPSRGVASAVEQTLYDHYLREFTVPPTIPAGSYILAINTPNGYVTTQHVLQVFVASPQPIVPVVLPSVVTKPTQLPRKGRLDFGGRRIKFAPGGFLWFPTGTGSIEITIENLVPDGWELDPTDPSQLSLMANGIIQCGPVLPSGWQPNTWPNFDVDITAVNCQFDGIAPGLIRHLDRCEFRYSSHSFGIMLYGQRVARCHFTGNPRFTTQPLSVAYARPYQVNVMQNTADGTGRFIRIDAAGHPESDPDGAKGICVYRNVTRNGGKNAANGGEKLFLVEKSGPGKLIDALVCNNDAGGPYGTALQVWAGTDGVNTFEGNASDGPGAYWFESSDDDQLGVNIIDEQITGTTTPFLFTRGYDSASQKWLPADGLTGAKGVKIGNVFVTAGLAPALSNPGPPGPFPGKQYETASGVYGEAACQIPIGITMTESPVPAES